MNSIDLAQKIINEPEKFYFQYRFQIEGEFEHSDTVKLAKDFMDTVQVLQEMQKRVCDWQCEEIAGHGIDHSFTCCYTRDWLKYLEALE